MKFLKNLVSFVSILLSAVILFAVAAPTISSFDEDAFLTRLSAAGIDTECDIIFTVSKGGSINMESGIYPTGQQLDLVATPKENYLFSGWYDENHTLLSLSPSFSFTVEADRRLYADFSPIPSKSEVGYETPNELLDCNESFQFIIACNEENALDYIRNNLVISDSFYNNVDLTDEEKALISDQLDIDFTVTENEDGTYTVTANEPYEQGATYTASLSEEGDGISFAGMEENGELTFTIEEENHATVVYKTGILHLLPGELLSIAPEGAEIGFRIASLDCFDEYENGGVGATVRIDEDETDDLDTLYGEVVAIRQETDGWFVSLTAPSLENIFEELDIYQSGAIDLENDTDLEITDEMIAEIGQQFLANEQVQSYLAASYIGIYDYMEENGYDVSSMSLKKLIEMIKVEPSMALNGDTLSFEIKATMNVEVAPLIYYYVSIEFAESVRLSVKANIEMKQAKVFAWTVTYGINTFDISLTTHETQRLGWEAGLRGDLGDGSSVGLNVQSEIELKIADSFKDVERLNENINSIKKVFAENGWSGSDNEKMITLPSIRWYLGLISFNADLSFSFEFDLNASISYTAITTVSNTTGFRMGADGNIRQYSTRNCQSSAENLYLHGKAGIRTCLQTRSYISLIGFSSWLQLGFETEFGTYAEAAGIIGLTWTGASSTGVAAGYWECGLYGSTNGFYKFFFAGDSVTFWQGEHILGRYGFTDAYTMLAYQSGQTSKHLDITEKRTDLDAQGIYGVITYSASQQNAGTVSLQKETNGYQVSLSLKEGTYLTIEDGHLVVKPNAPAVFDDELTIQVMGENTAWGPLTTTQRYVSYAKPITVAIHYHGDGYVDNTTEAKFRNIYQSHNASNAKVLQDVFQDYLLDLYEGNEAAEHFYLLAIEAYTGNLFACIDEMKAKEDENHTQETLFVETESEAFLALYGYLDGILRQGGDYRPTEQEISSMIDCIAVSQSCMNTLDDVAQELGNGSAVFAEEFGNMPTEVQELVADTLCSYYATAPTGSNGKLACEQIAYLLAIPLS